MTSTIYRQHDFRESLWSGGSTKELYIYPDDSSYTNRNFQLRISTAKVETPSSSFTILPGFQRKLMILEGEITINHTNHHSKVLKPFDVDAFSGDWSTSAVGTCVDFNVMTLGEIRSELFSVRLTSGQTSVLEFDARWNRLFCFVLNGELAIELNGDTLVVGSNEFLSIEELDSFSIPVSAMEDCTIVVVLVKL